MAGFLSFVVCLAISAGLGYQAYRRSQRHEMRGAARMAAYALVPIGLDLAGIVKLGRKIADAFGHWGVTLVFDPLVWLGIVLLGVAVLLWVVSGFGDDETSGHDAVTSTPRRAVGPSKQKASSSAMSGEDPEIEAILRKHGVS